MAENIINKDRYVNFSSNKEKKALLSSKHYVGKFTFIWM